MQAVGGAGVDQVTEQALGVAAEDAQLVAVGLDLGDAGALGQAGRSASPSGTGSSNRTVTTVCAPESARSSVDGALGEDLAVVDDRDRSQSASASSM